MDLTVPGAMGGKEAIKILKEYDPNIKVIVCSGYADDPIVANPKEYGFNAGIAKPVGIEKLSLVVKKTIEEW